MKIMLVGMQWDYCDPKRGEAADNLTFARTFEQLGHHVTRFWFDTYVNTNNYRQLQQDILIFAGQEKPDLIFFMTYTNQFEKKTLDALRDRYTTCAWFGDDQWRFNSYTCHYAPHFSHVVTTDSRSELKYKKMGLSPIISQWAGLGDSSKEMKCDSDHSYDFDVSFVGGTSPYRKWFVRKLQQFGFAVSCFGHGWPHGSVSTGEMKRIFYNSKINLNISNSANQDIRFAFSSLRAMVNYIRSPKRAEQVKARNFEIALSGGFQLTNYVVGLEDYYHLGEEIALYSCPEDCALQIEYFLHHEEKRKKIAFAGYVAARERHTYLQRLQMVIEACQT